MEDKCIYKIFVRKQEAKRALEDPRCSWEDNSKMNFR